MTTFPKKEAAVTKPSPLCSTSAEKVSKSLARSTCASRMLNHFLCCGVTVADSLPLITGLPKGLFAPDVLDLFSYSYIYAIPKHVHLIRQQEIHDKESGQEVTSLVSHRGCEQSEHTLHFSYLIRAPNLLLHIVVIKRIGYLPLRFTS